MLNLWTKRIVLASLLAMVSSLYIAVAIAEEKTESKEVEKEIRVENADHLKKVLKENDFNLEKAVKAESQVPRTYIANFPKDMRSVNNKTKKELFVQTLLPMILHENEIIMGERKQLMELKKAVESGKALKHYEQHWVNKVCEKYKMKKVDFNELLRRADIIPPSLALGQAIIESGLGVSYAALKKNSPFGMTISKKVKAYRNLSESVSAYIRNLNSNNAYRVMRKTREELRKANKDISGNILIGDMIAYCEYGQTYINQVRSAIKCNDLLKYDNLNLTPKETA